MEQHVFEHLLCPGATVVDPAVIVRIDGQARYGFDLLPRLDVEDGILFRVCQSGNCSCVDSGLVRRTVDLIFADGRRPMRATYARDNFSFVISSSSHK